MNFNAPTQKPPGKQPRLQALRKIICARCCIVRAALRRWARQDRRRTTHVLFYLDLLSSPAQQQPTLRRAGRMLRAGYQVRVLPMFLSETEGKVPLRFLPCEETQVRLALQTPGAGVALSTHTFSDRAPAPDQSGLLSPLLSSPDFNHPQENSNQKGAR